MKKFQILEGVCLTRPTYHYYTNLDNFRNAVTNVLTIYFEIKFDDTGEWMSNQISQEIDRVVPIIMARRPVHESFGTYANPLSPVSMELPLPLRNNFEHSTFSPVSTLTYYICVPVYLENTQNEGPVT